MTHTEALRRALDALNAIEEDPHSYHSFPGLVFSAIEECERALAALSVPSEPQTDWRKLALQFDSQRMSAMWHLQAMLQDAAGHAATAREFLAAAPTPQPAPAGWRLVPEGLTGGMLMAFHEISDADAMQYGQAGACWRAMLDAAPAAPGGAQ